MKRTHCSVAILAAFLFANGSVAVAQDGGKKAPSGHCEKVEGGKHVDLDPPADVADAKKWCKEQGGKWQKGKKHDHG